MALGLVGLILIQIGTALLSRLLAPRLPRRRPAPFEAPTVESGAPIPRGFGLHQISGVVTFVRETREIPDDDDEFVFYVGKMDMGLSYGPIHTIYDIVADERALSLQKPNRLQSLHGHEPLIVDPPFPIEVSGNDPVVIHIADRQIFGGQTKEGGLHGQIRIYPGTSAQPIDPLVITDLETLASAYPWLVHVLFGTAEGEPSDSDMVDQFLWTANTPTPKPVSFLLGYYPNALTASGGGTGRIGHDANWVEVIYETLTNKVWGKGVSVSEFDVPQWTAAAFAAYLDPYGGISGIIADRNIDDFLDDVKAHVDAEIVESPITGLLQIKVARADYVLLDQFEITSKNADNFEQGKAQFAETLNEIKVKYRRFEGGTPGITVDELVVDMLNGVIPVWGLYYQSTGRNITAVSAKLVRDAVDYVIPTNAYSYNSFRGDFFFTGFGPGALFPDWEEGDRIYVSFTSDPTFAGIVDDVATSQNPANRQIVGVVRSETYDYPFFTSPVAAQRKADLLRQLTSRTLDVFKWTMGRAGAHLTVMDMVRINDPTVFGLTNKAVRITKKTVGTLEHPEITFEGVEDIFGELVVLLFDSGSTGGGVPLPGTPPPMAGIYCEGEDTIHLQAGDATYDIEVQAADDIEGTGAVTLDTVPGTTTSIVDPTPGRVHRARQVRGAAVGEWTDWLAACLTGSPTCVELEIVDSPITDGNLGTLGVAINDDQHHLVSVEFQTTDASGITSAWVIATAPYSASVALLQGIICYIARRIVFYDCDSELHTSIERFPFTVLTTTPEEPGGLTRIPLDLSFDCPLNVLDIPLAETPVTSWRGAELKFPYDELTQVRIEATITKAGTDGSYLVGKFEAVESPGTYAPIGEGGIGPLLYLDEATLDALDPAGALLDPKVWVVAGDFVIVRTEAKADIRSRIDIGGGDDATGDVVFTRLALQPVAGPVPVVPPEIKDPPPQNPGSCDIPGDLDTFAYADLTALNADWPED